MPSNPINHWYLSGTEPTITWITPYVFLWVRTLDIFSGILGVFVSLTDGQHCIYLGGVWEIEPALQTEFGLEENVVLPIQACGLVSRCGL